MITDSKIIDKVINNPKNYAAIYARISGTTDNNSIGSQVQLATEALNKKNLLLYEVYTDFDSAKKLSPTKRKGLSKLILDAKAGCFKTVIIYRLDRLVRRYKDWLEIKNTFSKLGVNIVYSDESQSFDINSVQGEFFENLMVMVAEMEPDTISQRASNGRAVRRKQGAYSCGNKIPFGYIRQLRDESQSENMSKSIFINDPIKLAAIKFIFLEFSNLIDKEKQDTTTQYKASVHELYTALSQTITYIEATILKGEIPIVAINNNCTVYDLYKTINTYINLKGYDFVLENIKAIKNHYILDAKTNKKRNVKNLVQCLESNTYGGYMLEDANHPTLGLIYTSFNEALCYEEKLDEAAFIKTNNLEGIVPFEIFKKVYAYMTYKKLEKIDRTPNFLLKNTLKCSCSKKLKLIDTTYLHCGNSNCSAFLKDDLLKFIINKIVFDCLTKSDATIKKFLKLINHKTKTNSSNIYSLKKKGFEAVANYINYTDDTFIEDIYHNKQAINSYVTLSSQYRTKASHIESLLKEIVVYKESISSSDKTTDNYSSLSAISSKITDYILSTEDIFIPIFSEIIKEVKVKIKDVNSIEKGNIKIKYQFTAEKNSYLPESFN